MLSERMNDALNEQMKHELFSSYLYLAMAAYSDSVNLQGFANWMKVQAKEEFGHAMKFYGFINDRGSRAVFQALEQPPSEFDSAQDLFEKTLEHEKQITARINKLYDLAMEEDDKAAQVFLNWFIEEQVEEESGADEILQKLKMVGDMGHAIIMIDRWLAKRG